MNTIDGGLRFDALGSENLTEQLDVNELESRLEFSEWNGVGDMGKPPDNDTSCGWVYPWITCKF